MKKSLFTLNQILGESKLGFLKENGDLVDDVELSAEEAKLPEDVPEEAVNKAVEEGTIGTLFEGYLARTSMMALIIKENDEAVEDGEGVIEDKELEVAPEGEETPKEGEGEEELKDEEAIMEERFGIVLEADEAETPAEKKEDEAKAKSLWEKIKGKIQEIWNKIVGFVMTIMNKIRSFLNEKLGLYKKVLTQKDKIKKGMEEIKDKYTFKAVYSFDLDKAYTARKEFANVPSALKAIFDKTPDKLTDEDMKTLEDNKDAFKEAREAVKSKFGITENYDAPSLIRTVGFGEKLENVTLSKTKFTFDWVIGALNVGERVGEIVKSFEKIAKEAKKEHTLWKSFKNGMSSKALKASVKRDVFVRGYFNQQLAVNNAFVEILRSRAFVAYGIANAAIKAVA